MNLTGSHVNATGSQSTLEETVGCTLTVVALGVVINYINGTMVHTFTRHHFFQTNPRYILFIHLVLNDMIQLTLSITLLLLAYIFHTLYVSLCTLLILPAILTTQNTPLNLLFMAAECGISVCYPLRYSTLWTVRRTYCVVGSIWAISALSVLPDVVLLLATEPLAFLGARVQCGRDAVFRSSYSTSKRDVSHVVLLVVVWMTLLITYVRILFVAKTVEANARKARNTILLHGGQVLLCMLVYVQPMFTQFLLFLFPGHIRLVYFIVYIINQIFPRLANPIVYGLRDATFRRYFRKQLGCTDGAHVHPQSARL